MFKKLNITNNDSEPDINIAEDQRKRQRNFVIVFAVLAVIFFNLIMWMLSKV